MAVYFQNVLFHFVYYQYKTSLLKQGFIEVYIVDFSIQIFKEITNKVHQIIIWSTYYHQHHTNVHKISITQTQQLIFQGSIQSDFSFHHHQHSQNHKSWFVVWNEWMTLLWLWISSVLFWVGCLELIQLAALSIMIHIYVHSSQALWTIPVTV